MTHLPDFVGGDKSGYMFVVTIYIMVGMTVFTTIIEIVRRQYAESWRKMQELRAQIQAQLKLADTLKKISEAAGGKWQYFRREKTILFFLLVNFCSKLIVIALEIDSNYAIREKYFQMTSLSTS